MALEVYNTVSSGEDCARIKNNTNHRRQLHLFPATGPLNYVAMDVLDPLPETAKGNQHVAVITDGSSKLKRAVPTARVATNSVAELLLNACVIHTVYRHII